MTHNVLSYEWSFKGTLNLKAGGECNLLFSVIGVGITSKIPAPHDRCSTSYISSAETQLISVAAFYRLAALGLVTPSKGLSRVIKTWLLSSTKQRHTCPQIGEGIAAQPYSLQMS